METVEIIEVTEVTEKKPTKKENRALKMLKKAEGGFFRDFKAFISRGNILQLAIAFVMGAAFTAIVNSLVGDIFMQFFSLIFGKSDIGELAWVINDTPIRYGNFLMAILNFLLVALVLFFIIKIAAGAGRGFKKLKKGETPPPPPPPAEKVEDILKDIRKILQESDKRDET
jgi:large conductance mechanosensitive channel